MAQHLDIAPHLVDQLRRDLTQIQLLADIDALGPEDLRRLLGSLGELVNSVEILADCLRQVTQPVPDNASAFRSLQDQFGVTRMRSVNGLGVIDGGLS